MPGNDSLIPEHRRRNRLSFHSIQALGRVVPGIVHQPADRIKLKLRLLGRLDGDFADSGYGFGVLWWVWGGATYHGLRDEGVAVLLQCDPDRERGGDEHQRSEVRRTCRAVGTRCMLASLGDSLRAAGPPAAWSVGFPERQI